MTDQGQAGSTAGSDVVDLLATQHNQVRQLFTALTAGTGERQRDFEELVRMLAVHETAEEEVVYPELRADVPGGDAIADARTHEEDKAKKVLADLEKLGVDGDGFAEQFEQFRVMVLDHAEAEEREVFPLLREFVGPEQRQRMRELFEAAEAAAPTHPHKLAPESAVANVLVGPAVALFDKVRDAIREATRR